MLTINKANKEVLLLLCKDFSTMHTISSVAKESKMSRVGMWKILKALESENLIKLKQVGSGKTSASIAKLQWGNILVKKSLELYLTEESEQQRRWKVNFAELEKIVDFTILYGSILQSAKANDIDIANIAQRKNFIKVRSIIDKVQKTQTKRIHAINFTAAEFKQELINKNKAFIDALKKGIILFGQENFVEFIEGLHEK